MMVLSSLKNTSGSHREVKLWLDSGFYRVLSWFYGLCFSFFFLSNLILSGFYLCSHHLKRLVLTSQTSLFTHRYHPIRASGSHQKAFLTSGKLTR